MQRHISVLILLILFIQPVMAQELNTLKELQHNSFKAYYSAGHDKRTASIAHHVEKAIAFHEKLLGIKPAITLLVLSPSDWKIFSLPGAVYGMPHYDNANKRLIVAAEDNPFWKSFLPPLERIPAELREPISTTYKSSDGGISAQAFFDLLALHELGHAFHIQGGLTMQRKWMGEMFSNLFLHTYIAEMEPGLLPALTLFPKMVVAGGTKGMTYTSLADLEAKYNDIATTQPRNYGWYQCRWHYNAGVIYDAGGKQVVRNLRDALTSQKEILSDDQLIAYLEKSGAKGVADMIRTWDKDTVR